MATAPPLPRPAKGFTPAHARKWILTSALVTAMIYAVRHLVEGETSPAPTGAAKAFLGSGAPPSFGQWIISYSVAFLGLTLLATGAPEIAGALAIFVLAVTMLESGGQLANDLGLLETGQAGAGATPTASAAADGSGVVLGAAAPSPQSVGAQALARFTAGNLAASPTAKLNVAPGGVATTAPAVAPPPLSIPGEHYDPHTGMYEPNG